MHRKSRSNSPKTPARQAPELAEWLLRRVTPAPERDAIAGDLEEEYRQLHDVRGALRARRWYWSQVARSLRPGMQRPLPPLPGSGRRPSRVQGGRTMPLADFRQDVRWALRGLAKSPSFTAISVLTLALAIGVNSAIFSMVGVMFFGDMPVTNTESFAFFWTQNPAQGARRRPMSLLEYVAHRDGVPAMRHLVAMRQDSALLTDGEEPLTVAATEATANLWDAWGTPPILGRGFTEEEARPGGAEVVVLSHGFWERQFSADPDVVGRRLRIDGNETTVIGVMPEVYEFGDMARYEIWRPLRITAEVEPSTQRGVFVTGRLAPGASHTEARQQAAAVTERLQREFPDAYAGWQPQVMTFDEGLASDNFWPVMILLSVTVGFVMLMACSNIASMMLARGSARAREIAVRAALGAGRLRIVRGLLTEGALLSLAAALLGLLVARAAMSGLVWIAGNNSNITFLFRMLEIDRNVLAFTMLVAVLSPLLFSLLPALRVTRTSLVDTLKGTGGGGASAGLSSLRARRVLVAGQVALALGLMVVAGVLMRSLVEIRAMDLGYDARALLTLRVDLQDTTYTGIEQRQQFFRDTVARVRALPEVEAAAWVSRRPIAEQPRGATFEIRGRGRDESERAPRTGVVTAEPEYFELINVRLLSGRMFGRQDTATSLPVVLVNQDVVTRYWPEGNPVGEHVQLSSDRGSDRWLQVVGVVSSLAQPDPSTPSAPLFYVPFEQSQQSSMALVARPRGEPREATGAIRRAVWATAPDLPIADVRTMAQIFSDAVAPMDAILSMFGAFALFALAMAAAGIYGVMSVLVAQRTREFGIRMALGADRRAVRSMVVRGSAILVLGGAMVGVLVGYGLATALASGIGDVDAADPLVYAAVAVTLTAAAFASLWLPTRRATRVDPLIALRAE